MNKSVLDKLAKFESNVELAEVKVDLALYDEIKVRAKQSATRVTQFAKQKALILKTVASLNEASKDIILNKDYAKKLLAAAKTYQAQMEKLSKELGVSLKGSEPDKLLSDLFMYAEDSQGDIDDALAALKTIKS
jgi:uncharacterized protein YjbK